MGSASKEKTGLNPEAHFAISYWLSDHGIKTPFGEKERRALNAQNYQRCHELLKRYGIPYKEAYLGTVPGLALCTGQFLKTPKIHIEEFNVGLFIEQFPSEDLPMKISIKIVVPNDTPTYFCVVDPDPTEETDEFVRGESPIRNARLIRKVIDIIETKLSNESPEN